MHVLSHRDGIGVVAAINARHLLVARLVSRVTLGLPGSPGGVAEPSPPYSSARPKALCPISWMAISLACGSTEQVATEPPDPPYFVELTMQSTWFFIGT